MLIMLLSGLYIICAVLLALFALGTTILLAAYWRHRRQTIPTPTITDLPVVAVQLPVYNERYVVERLLTAVDQLDYPRDKLIVQVLDDSTDETSAIIAKLTEKLCQDGLNMMHIQRKDRAGYKAGALAYGLSLIECEYVAVFDADFVPPPDFLRRTVPHLVADSSLGMVQGRWGHLNSFGNLYTIVQTLALDGHFVVEQTGRNRSGWLINFNGSGGVWRVAAINAAGGWRASTLTEDLDLSYRAQLEGWQLLYLPDVVIPGELPPQLAAYKQQQARWAKGGTQCLAQLVGPIWQTRRLTLVQRIMATLHLSQYMAAPIIILLLLLTPPLLILQGYISVPLGPIGLAGLGPPLMLIVGQWALYSDWRRRALVLPASVVMATGLTWSNTRAVVGALVGGDSEFKRTPKFARDGRFRVTYALRGDGSIIIEALLSLYALVGALIALRFYPGLVAYLVIYCVAFGVIAIWGVSDVLLLRTQSVSQA